MKVVVSVISVLASIATIYAVLASLRWRRGIQDDIPLTAAQKALYIGAITWLGLFGLFLLFIVTILVVPAIVKLFV